jgi:hypothetical protein
MNATSDRWPMLRERYGDGILGHPEIRCPVAEKAAYEEGVWMHYPHLSGTEKDLEDIVEAVAKVQRLAHRLRD